MRQDLTVWPVLEALEQCLCSEFADEEMCFCGIQAGDASLIEYVREEGSMAWVRLDNIFTSRDFPNPDTEVGCDTMTAFVVEIGAATCFPMGAEPPTAEQYREGARTQINYMMALMRSVVCCPALEDLQYVIGEWTPYGPQGGVLGGSWTVTIEGEYL